MKKWLLIAVSTMVLSVGCFQGQTQPTDQPQQPVLGQSTTGITQYDYQAGYPNQYPDQPLDSDIPESSSNPYLNQNSTQPIPSLEYDNSHNVPFVGGWWYYPNITVPKEKILIRHISVEYENK